MKETKEIILETAYQMFLGNNYEAVTISSIIKATGLTKGAIYHYYESKEELFKAVVDTFLMKEDVPFSLEAESFGEFISKYVELKKQHYFARKDVFQTQTAMDDRGYCGAENVLMQHLSLVVSAYRYYPECMDKGHSLFMEGLDKWKQIIEEGIRRGELRKDVNAELMAVTFLFADASAAFCNMLKGEDLDSTFVLYEKQMKEWYKNIKA